MNTALPSSCYGLATAIACAVHIASYAAPAAANTLEDVFAVRDTFTFERTATEAVMAGPVVLLRAFDGTVSAVETETGAVLWRKPSELGPETRFRVRGELVFLMMPHGIEAIRLSNGMRSWTWAPGCAGPCRVRVIAESPDMLVAETADAHWHALDVNSGRVLWRAPAPTTVGGNVAISPHAVIVGVATWAGGIELAFHDRDTGREMARWKSPTTDTRFAPVWHATARGARVIIPGNPTQGAAQSPAQPNLAQVLVVDATGRTADTRSVGALTGIGTHLRWFGIGADEAWVHVDDPATRRAHLLRINDRSKGRIEVEIATGMGHPFEITSAGALLMPPEGGSALWGFVRPGRKMWRATIEGMSPAARVFALNDRHGLIAHHDGLVECDVALEKVTGVGVLDLEPGDPILAAGWAGRTPVVVQGTRMTLYRRMKVIEVRDKLKQAGIRGVDTRPLRDRLGRFLLLRERIQMSDAEAADFDAESVTNDAKPNEVTPDRTADKTPEPVSDPVEVRQPPPSETVETKPDTAAGEGTAAPSAQDAERKAMALFPDEQATLATLRGAWFSGDHTSVAAAARTWLERANVPASEPQRVAGALGWLFFELVVAPDNGDGLEWLLAPARFIGAVRDGLPAADRVAWALIAARAGDNGLAAEFLDGVPGSLTATARRALALRAMKAIRDSVGDLRSDSTREMFGTALKNFKHVELLFGPSANRVKDLSGRLGGDATLVTEIDGYLHVIGIKKVGRGAMDVETCALGCDIVSERCGFGGDPDPCVKRCMKHASVRLAGVPRPNAADPQWFCGL